MNKMKKILFDVSFIIDNTNTGIAKYALRILEYIRNNELQSNFILICHILCEDFFNKEYPDFKKIIIGERWVEHTRFFKYFIYSLYFNRAVNQIDSTVLFCPYGSQINCFVKNKKKITTIHDLQVRIDKKIKKRMVWRQIYSENRMVKTSDNIFTISDFARRQILEYYPDIDNKLLNMSNLVSMPHYDNIKPMSPGYDYILYVGRLDLMKNISTLLKAYKCLSDKNVNCKLVLVSHTVNYYLSDLLPYVEKNNLQDKIVLVKKCSEYELIRWYMGCKLFVFPSLREGFGFPPIEAGILKAPVLTSKADSLEEVTMGLVNYYDNPTDYIELSEKIKNCLDYPMSNEQLETIRKRFVDNYSINNVGKKICDFLFKVADNE